MNGPGGGGAAGGQGASANPLPNFSSPFFDPGSLGTFTSDLPSRHLSPSVASARLSFTPMQSMSAQQQQSHQAPHHPTAHMMFAPVTNGGNNVTSINTLQQQQRAQQQQPPSQLVQQGGSSIGQPQRQAFGGGNSKAQQTTMNVTKNLANLERFAQSRSSNANSTNFQMDPNSGRPLSANAGDSLASQQQQNPTPEQTPSMVAPPGAGMVGSGYFGSPLLSTTIDFPSRQLTPPSTSAILSAILPETPAQPPSHLAPMGEVNVKKSAAVVSNLMNAERQTQKRRESEQQTPSSSMPSHPHMSSQGGAGKGPMQAPQRLFAPLDQAGMMRSHPQTAGQQQGQQQAAANLLKPNMLHASRLSAGGDDSFLDWNLGDMGYTFSPGEMVRSLGPAGPGGIPESPLTQSMRMFPYNAGGPPGYGGMMPPQPLSNASSWQYPGSLPPQQRYSVVPPMDMVRHAQQQPPLPLHGNQQLVPSASASAGTAAGNSKKRPKSEDKSSGSSSSSSNNKKKSSKQADPDEPKITSKHRGVCWYKRTKKWVVQTKVNGKRVHVGYFDDEEKAAQAYKEAVQSIQIKKALDAKQKAMEGRQQDMAALPAPQQPTV